MNELQIRLSADISALTSALNKAKATIKSFESETEKESEKGNVGFKRKIGLIESLTNKAKALRTALSQATNEQQIERYNQELEQTSKELTRLNALGRTVTANLSGVGGGFNQIATKGANANGVALEFNRVIQDAPFGLIGIGNNLQQLASNFALVTAEAKKTGGTVGTALKASFSSMVSPVNLALLAVSALTAAFTAYQMGAFDGIFATEDFSESLEKFKDSLNAVDSARLEGIGNADKELVTLNSLKGIIESETTSREAKLDAVNKLQDLYPAYFGNLSKEQILAGDLAKTYEALTKTIIAKAQAEASVGKFVELAQEERLILQKTAEERERIAEFEAKALKNQIDGQTELQTINENQVRFLTGKIQPELNRINEIKAEQKTLESDITANLIEANAVLTVQKTKVDDIGKSYDELIAKVEMTGRFQAEATNKFQELAKGLGSGSGGVIDIPIEIDFKPEGGNMELGLVQQLQEQIKSINALRDVATDPTRIQMYNEQLKALQDQLSEFTKIQDPLVEQNRILLDSFSALGIGIAASLDISNNAFKGFVTTVLSAVPKIIQAIIAQSAAKKAAAASEVATNAQVAASEGIAVASKAANALGPVGLALLPVFIGGALAIIGGAFSKIGGGGNVSGGGGSVSTGAPPQIFTNKNTVTPPNQNSPNYNPGSDIDWSKAQGRLFVDVEFDKLRFGLDMASERKMSGG